MILTAILGHPVIARIIAGTSGSSPAGRVIQARQRDDETERKIKLLQTWQSELPDPIRITNAYSHSYPLDRGKPEVTSKYFEARLTLTDPQTQKQIPFILKVEIQPEELNNQVIVSIAEDIRYSTQRDPSQSMIQFSMVVNPPANLSKDSVRMSFTTSTQDRKINYTGRDFISPELTHEALALCQAIMQKLPEIWQGSVFQPALVPAGSP